MTQANSLQMESTRPGLCEANRSWSQKPTSGRSPLARPPAPSHSGHSPACRRQTSWNGHWRASSGHLPPSGGILLAACAARPSCNCTQRPQIPPRPARMRPLVAPAGPVITGRPRASLARRGRPNRTEPSRAEVNKTQLMGAHQASARAGWACARSIKRSPLQSTQLSWLVSPPPAPRGGRPGDLLRAGPPEATPARIINRAGHLLPEVDRRPPSAPAHNRPGSRPLMSGQLVRAGRKRRARALCTCCRAGRVWRRSLAAVQFVASGRALAATMSGRALCWLVGRADLMR